MYSSVEDLSLEIEHLKKELGETHSAIDAIKSGSVDAFAIRKDGKAEVYTLQSLDYSYRILIEKINEGLVNITNEGLIVYSNSYFSRLVKKPIQKVTGSSILDMISTESQEIFREHCVLALQGNSKTEITLSVDNENIPVSVSLTSLQPQLDVIGVIVTDLSERKHHEKLILQQSSILQKKNLYLEYLNENLEQFAFIASHDLKEPLRKIMIFTSQLKHNLPDLSEKNEVLIDKIRGTSEHMSVLIKEVLNFSRTTNSEATFVKTDLNEVLRNVLRDFDLLILEKNASFKSEHLPVIEAIPFQINQLFYNLISNCLKFSRGEIAPEITISSRMLSSKETLEYRNLNRYISYVEIIVKDNGIGFEQIFAKQIFSIFERLNSQKQYSGTGIGLALCQKIANNHQGLIYALGEENEGATFFILLPLNQHFNN